MVCRRLILMLLIPLAPLCLNFMGRLPWNLLSTNAVQRMSHYIFGHCMNIFLSKHLTPLGVTFWFCSFPKVHWQHMWQEAALAFSLDLLRDLPSSVVTIYQNQSIQSIYQNQSIIYQNPSCILLPFDSQNGIYNCVVYWGVFGVLLQMVKSQHRCEKGRCWKLCDVVPTCTWWIPLVVSTFSHSKTNKQRKTISRMVENS